MFSIVDASWPSEWRNHACADDDSGNVGVPAFQAPGFWEGVWDRDRDSVKAFIGFLRLNGITTRTRYEMTPQEYIALQASPPSESDPTSRCMNHIHCGLATKNEENALKIMTSSPPLHSVCTRAAAIQAFTRDVPPESYCDQQVVSLPDAILIFITLGNTPHDSEVPMPSHVIWKSAPIQANTSDPYSWFPGRARETRDGSGKLTRRHQVFLRQSDSDQYTYCGSAHLASYTAAPKRQAEFELDVKLTRDLWIQFGGFDGWLIDANHSSHRLRTTAHADFTALLESLQSQEHSHLCMTRYEEDSLHLYLNSERAWLMYLRNPADSGLYLSSVVTPGSDDPYEQFQCTCGICLECVPSSTTTHQEAFAMVTSFFLNGIVPEQLCCEM